MHRRGAPSSRCHTSTFALKDLLPAAIGVLIVTTLATIHLRKESGKVAKSISSILLLLLTYYLLAAFDHACDQGRAPHFVRYGLYCFCVAVPWVFPKRPWTTRATLFAALSVGMTIVIYLTDSYHGDSITGNPHYSSGRFWHTPFTGQYPRDPNIKFGDRILERRKEAVNAARKSRSEQAEALKPQPRRAEMSFLISKIIPQSTRTSS